MSALCGTVVLAAFVAAVALDVGSRRTENTEAPVQDSPATTTNFEAPIEGSSQVISGSAGAIGTLQMTAMGEDGVLAAGAATIVGALSDLPPLLQPEIPAVQTASANAPDPMQSDTNEAAIGDALSHPPALFQPETPPVQLALANMPDPVQHGAKEEVSSVETPEACVAVEICVDQYLWSVYQRAPKLDTTKVRERTKVTVKKNGKTRTIVKTTIRLVDNDFTWKDPKAAERAGMSLKDYVIGGMDRGFKLKLYHALRAMDDAGLSPGITSGFRDDYRQSIASGQRAATSDSYHGGSRRGGYGHGLAADLVGVKGETRDERWSASEALWKWIDVHGSEFGIGRPYLDGDPPHVGPIDGKEYADKRGRAYARRAGAVSQRHRSAVRDDHSRTKRATTASPKAKSS